MSDWVLKMYRTRRFYGENRFSVSFVERFVRRCSRGALRTHSAITSPSVELARRTRWSDRRSRMDSRRRPRPPPGRTNRAATADFTRTQWKTVLGTVTTGRLGDRFVLSKVREGRVALPSGRIKILFSVRHRSRNRTRRTHLSTRHPSPSVRPTRIYFTAHVRVHVSPPCSRVALRNECPLSHAA